MVSVLFEDNDILTVNKAEGLAAIPERCARGDSLFETLSGTRDEKLYIVHRIDKETSGLIVFARNAAAHRWLCRQFEQRAVVKTYLALCHGTVAEDRGVIDTPLRQFGSGRVAVDPERGKPSATEFRIVERFQSHTLIEARPHTGRRHQIRVHLYHLGHPIAGDPLYGDASLRPAFSRMMLHAWKLSLRLPSGETVALEASIPDSFESILKTIEGQQKR